MPGPSPALVISNRKPNLKSTCSEEILPQSPYTEREGRKTWSRFFTQSTMNMKWFVRIRCFQCWVLLSRLPYSVIVFSCLCVKFVHLVLPVTSLFCSSSTLSPVPSLLQLRCLHFLINPFISSLGFRSLSSQAFWLSSPVLPSSCLLVVLHDLLWQVFCKFSAALSVFCLVLGQPTFLCPTSC